MTRWQWGSRFAVVALAALSASCDRTERAQEKPQRIVGCVTPRPEFAGFWYVQFGEGTCQGGRRAGTSRDRASLERAVQRVAEVLTCAQDPACKDFAIAPELRPQLTASRFITVARTPQPDVLMFFFDGRQPMESLMVTVDGDDVAIGLATP